MEVSLKEFFHDFRQELQIDAEENKDFSLSKFMEAVTEELCDTGFSEGFEFCHYRAQRGIRVDGYWFNEEDVLNLFIADFDDRVELATLTRTEIDAAFKRLSNFLDACLNRNLANDLEETSPAFGLARQITDRGKNIRQINLILCSERVLSERIQSIPDTVISEIPASFQVWDISRLYRQHFSRNHKEALDLNFEEMFGNGIACLLANTGTEGVQSYLAVMPAEILASLYGKYGARLLEQNVRTFLQVRGNVNKGIRSTILKEPEMFFSFNNGITATAQKIETKETGSGLEIIRIVDLQIVNGGQTTASLFHAQRRDKANLEKIFVQMKLSSIVDAQQSEIVVPKISEYANTQNRVNAADFFSNHPFHVRMEEFSRRIWAPPQKGFQRQTKWFYERARGQYADAQSGKSAADQRNFKAQYPKAQMFTKTHLAKFENVWDEHPKWVNLGAQKNFGQYAARIGNEWEKNSDRFNERYFKQIVARGVIFLATERLVSNQPWYNGGYRANVVAYTLATLSEIARRRHANVDFQRVWNEQAIYNALEKAIIVLSAEVNKVICQPASGISNISEWSKKEACWDRIRQHLMDYERLLPEEFYDQLLSQEEAGEEEKVAKNTQKIDNGIEAQKRVLDVSAEEWSMINRALLKKGLLTLKEEGILKIAMQIPMKLPTEKQCVILLGVLEKARAEGL